MDAEGLQFHALLSQCATDVEAALETYLPGEDQPLGASMRYAVLSGGKRLRAFLAMESAALYRIPKALGLRTAAAVECIHAYSLVHDDLPCMDDDDLRRGKPTVHKKWDEATAVLTGDALQSMAFEILGAQQSGIDPRVQVRLLVGLAEASGASGMAGGQALDIAAGQGQLSLNLDDIKAMQRLKTGALIEWAATSGSVLARSNGDALRNYAADLGLAFQIQDDILDVEGNSDLVGKALRKDDDAGKATFVSLAGLPHAKKTAKDLIESACAHLAPFGSAAENLRRAARFAIARDA